MGCDDPIQNNSFSHMIPLHNTVESMSLSFSHSPKYAPITQKASTACPSLWDALKLDVDIWNPTIFVPQQPTSERGFELDLGRIQVCVAHSSSGRDGGAGPPTPEAAPAGNITASWRIYV